MKPTSPETMGKAFTVVRWRAGMSRYRLGAEASRLSLAKTDRTYTNLSGRFESAQGGIQTASFAGLLAAADATWQDYAQAITDVEAGDSSAMQILEWNAAGRSPAEVAKND